MFCAKAFITHCHLSDIVVVGLSFYDFIVISRFGAVIEHITTDATVAGYIKVKVNSNF